MKPERTLLTRVLFDTFLVYDFMFNELGLSVAGLLTSIPIHPASSQRFESDGGCT